MSFFFQAEDGIRDGRVTGVQTCALPIWQRMRLPPAAASAAGGRCCARAAGPRPGCCSSARPGSRCAQIGRASCRERGESRGGAGSLKRKNGRRDGGGGAGRAGGGGGRGG